MTNHEINTAIAEKVMEWKKDKVYITNTGELIDAWMEESTHVFCDEWKPTERIEQAWRVVEKLKDGCKIEFGAFGWQVSFYDQKSPIPDRVYGYAPEITLAICLAALRAVGVEIEAT